MAMYLPLDRSVASREGALYILSYSYHHFPNLERTNICILLQRADIRQPPGLHHHKS
ncbi:MAG: hypothetical protein AAB037_02035 [Chloroflexota bacterium]